MEHSSASKGQDENSNSSILTDETGGNDEEIMGQIFQKVYRGKKKIGLVTLSLEGNELIGDKGADAIAGLIQTQSPFSNNLKIVNLNECGITNVGFEKLRKALQQRANLANRLNLTHVKITIERNNIEQME